MSPPTAPPATRPPQTINAPAIKPTRTTATPARNLWMSFLRIDERLAPSPPDAPRRAIQGTAAPQSPSARFVQPPSPAGQIHRSIESLISPWISSMAPLIAGSSWSRPLAISRTRSAKLSTLLARIFSASLSRWFNSCLLGFGVHIGEGGTTSDATAELRRGHVGSHWRTRIHPPQRRNVSGRRAHGQVLQQSP